MKWTFPLVEHFPAPRRCLPTFYGPREYVGDNGTAQRSCCSRGFLRRTLRTGERGKQNESSEHGKNTGGKPEEVHS